MPTKSKLDFSNGLLSWHIQGLDTAVLQAPHCFDIAPKFHH